MSRQLPFVRSQQILSVLALGAAMSCGGSEIVQGECAPLHGAEVCVWEETRGEAVISFGATIPIAAIENAPADAEMVWPPVAGLRVPLPGHLSEATGMRSMTVYWEPHGHPPGPYLTPHFDFHFNNVTAAARAAIDCSDLTKPAQLPAGYTLPDVDIPGLGNLVGLCVPQMGMHAVLESELTATTPFRATMIVGYYAGKPVFIEPMVTREMLLERKSFTLDVPTIPGLPASVRYPTSFRADFDEKAQAYRFVFEGIPAAPSP